MSELLSNKISEALAELKEEYKKRDRTFGPDETVLFFRAFQLGLNCRDFNLLKKTKED